jgi:uracil-DNA glycosylase
MPLRPLFQMNGTVPAAISGRTLSCVSCGLSKGVPAEDHEVITKRMPPWGENRLGLMIIGEAPGRDEDHEGMPWQGRAGRMLESALRDHGIDLARDCVSLNAVNCRPIENRTPTPFEVACCREVKVLPAIRQYRPKLILLMGGSAVSSVIGSVLAEGQDAAIGRWRGNQIPLLSLGAWLAPSFHPSYIMREEKRPEIETVWRKDIAAALPLIDAPLPDPGSLRDKVILLRDERSVLRALERVKVKKGYLSFDYETTGLRASLHNLVSISFAQSPDWAFSFMYPGRGAVHDAWRDILVDDAIGKISHNLSFEYEWSRHHFELDHIAWAWDSMLAAHVVDNRPGICGLKHQVFVNFGISSYDTDIEPYLKSRDPRNPAALNRIDAFIDKYGEDELLIYNGIDALAAYRLSAKQMGQLTDA